jgi:hypothetical protein
MTQRNGVASRGMVRAATAAFIFSTMVTVFSIRATALEFVSLPGQGGGSQPFSIDLPVPAYRFDKCESMLNHMRETGALSETRDTTPDNRGLAVIVGMRFSFGGPKNASRTASVGVWQPVHGASQRTLAMSEYEGCRNDQAMRAAFGN